MSKTSKPFLTYLILLPVAFIELKALPVLLAALIGSPSDMELWQQGDEWAAQTHKGHSATVLPQDAELPDNYILSNMLGKSPDLFSLQKRPSIRELLLQFIPHRAKLFSFQTDHSHAKISSLFTKTIHKCSLNALLTFFFNLNLPLKHINSRSLFKIFKAD